MKTKNLMTAFALSAMFAACTQDAELNETLAKNDFSNIPMVEAEFTADFGVESRMATKFGLEVGDKVGLAWLGTGSILDGNTSGMAYQNHPLFCTNAAKKSFKTETMLYVGEYFAYLPYTQGDMAIENIAFSIAKQPLTTNSDELGKQAIYLSTETTILEKANDKGEVTDGAQKAGMGNDVKLNLALLNNPTTIKLAFKNIEALTNLKVTGISVDMNNGSYSSGSALIKNFKHNGKIEDWTEMTGADFVAINSTFERGAVELEGELAVANNSLTTYALLLPSATELGGTTLNITLTTNYGIVVADNVKVDNAKLFTNFGQVATVTADVDGKKIKNTVATAKTQEELNDILTKLAASAQKDAVVITLNPETAANPKAPFTLTDFTLPETLKANVTLTTGDNAKEEIVFAGNTVINKPIVVNKNAKVTGTMTVKYVKDAISFTSVALTTIANEASLINEGSLLGNFTTAAATTGDDAKIAGKYISNGEHAALAGNFANSGEAQWIAGTVPTYTGNHFYAIATSLKEMNHAGFKNVKTVRLYNATITNEYQNWVTPTYLNYLYTIECYGNVAFNLTSTMGDNTPCAIHMTSATIEVKDNATLTISSNNAQNHISLHSAGTPNIVVGKNASLNVSNTNTTAIVDNWGAVSLVDATSITEHTEKHEGSTWKSVTNQ